MDRDKGLEAELEELMRCVALQPSPSLPRPSHRACVSRRFNETLMRENELFESHLRRVAPQLLTEDDEAQGKGKRKAIVAAKKAQAVLAPEQKYEVASQEMEEVRDEIEATKGCGERAPASPRATTSSLPALAPH